MSIIDNLIDKSLWQEYLQHKLTKSHLTSREEKSLIDFIDNEKYMEIAKSIMSDNYTFSIPTKTLINKSGSSKKRVVYTFSDTENTILKFILFQMYRYDHHFADNCYSFRKNFTVKKAITTLITTPNIDNLWAYKVDISNYFNSINVDTLLKQLEYILADDTRLFNLIKNILTLDKAIYKDKIIEEKRGAMAGTALSAFFANIYLKDLDNYFSQNNILYARYSDDIIVFAETKEKLDTYRLHITNHIKNMELLINPDKEEVFEPNNGWTFLGFEYKDKKIDISSVTLKKLKDKIRRKARALYRWKLKNEKTTEHTSKVLIRVFNNKFYREKNTKDLSFCKWYFPILSTHERLQEIDKYLVQYIRYLSSGRFTKKNYNIKYEHLKSLGFRSLVHEYYNFIRNTHTN